MCCSHILGNALKQTDTLIRRYYNHHAASSDDLKSDDYCDLAGIAHIPEGKVVWVNHLSGGWPSSADSCTKDNAHVIDKANCSVCGCEKNKGFRKQKITWRLE